MSVAKVTTSERELVPSRVNRSIMYTGLLVPTSRGSLEPRITYSFKEFLNEYAPNGIMETGLDPAFDEAKTYFQLGGALIAQRVSTNPLHAGLEVHVEGASAATVVIGAGIDNVKNYIFSGISANLLVHAINPGSWGNNITFTLAAYAPITNAYSLQVYFKNIKVEDPIIFSLDRNAKDGFNRNIYVETSCQTSSYVRIIHNLAGTGRPSIISSRVPLVKGGDGQVVTIARMVEVLNSAFSNANEITVNLIMDGGCCNTMYHSAMLTLSESRDDCYAIMSIPYEAEASSAYINNMILYRYALSSSSSYGSLYAGYLKIKDSVSGNIYYNSPSGAIAGRMSQLSLVDSIFRSATGLQRGVLQAGGEIVGLRRIFTEPEQNTLVEAGINPVRWYPKIGAVVWGHKNLLTTPSLFDRANVRLMLNKLKPQIVAIGNQFLFTSDPDIQYQIQNAVSSVFRDHIGVTCYNARIENFTTVNDIRSDKLKFGIFITPMRDMEEINFDFVLTPYGTNLTASA